jgi:hypothetical protein
MSGSNEFIAASLLKDDGFLKAMQARLQKADTISQSTGLLWYDLRPVVQLLYPFKELIPLISKLPRVPADGGNAYHWLRITAINTSNVSPGVSEGNRGARIALAVQGQQATYKTLGLESSVTFDARLGSQNLTPDALGNAVQSTLRATMIAEEQTLILGNASTPLGTTPTPTLTAAGSGSSLAAVEYYVTAVALAGLGWLNYTPWNNTTSTGGVPGQVTKTNADGSTDTFGGGSAQPSTAATITPTAGQNITASLGANVSNAVAYAWFIGTSVANGRLVGVTQGPEVIINAPASGTAQPLTSLQTGGTYQDNSTNALLPDGILSQIYGSVFGSAPANMRTDGGVLPSANISMTSGGALVYNASIGNTGLTIDGTNVVEFDLLLEAAYNVYKVGFDRILMSASDLAAFSGTMFAGSASNTFRILFDADQTTGRIVAGRRVTSYLNKFYGNTLDIEVHPYLPPGTVLFWSDRQPYELSGVTNILEAHVRQDYYQIQWPLNTRRYEYGVYVDEVFSCYFTPAFAAIAGLNPAAGVTTI